MKIVSEIWKENLKEKDIEKEENLIKNREIGRDQPPKETRILSAGEILDSIARKTERELQGVLSENEAIELHEILGRMDKSQIGKILELKKEEKIEEIKRLIQSS